MKLSPTSPPILITPNKIAIVVNNDYGILYFASMLILRII